jgi:hypothetical protein
MLILGKFVIHGFRVYKIYKFDNIYDLIKGYFYDSKIDPRLINIINKQGMHRLDNAIYEVKNYMIRYEIDKIEIKGVWVENPDKKRMLSGNGFVDFSVYEMIFRDCELFTENFDLNKYPFEDRIETYIEYKEDKRELGLEYKKMLNVFKKVSFVD